MATVKEFLEEHKVAHSTTHHHSRAGWIQIQTCPFCHSNNYHLGVTTDGRRCSCWKCGSHPVAKALQLVSNASWSQIKALTPDYDEVAPKREYGGYKEPLGVVDLLPPDRDYLAGRGLDPDKMVELWGVKSIHPAAGIPQGVFIPITHKGVKVSWTIRFRNPLGKQRYKTATDDCRSMSEKELVFGADRGNQRSIVVVEGPFDLFKVGIGGGCIFGLQYSMAQVKILAQFHFRVICFDNSADAQRRATLLSSELSAYPGLTVQVCLQADDPGSASEAEIRELRELAGI